MNKNLTITLKDFSRKFSEQLSRGNQFTLVEQLRKESMATAVQPHAHAGWELRLRKDGAWDLIPPNTLHGCNFCSYSIEVDFRHIMITCLDDDTLLKNWSIPNEVIPFHLAPELFSMLEHNKENVPLAARLFEAALFSLLDIFERFSRLSQEQASHNLADTVRSFLEHRYYRTSLSLDEVAMVF
ncbi:MAG: hypothetical protein MJ106_01795, partial [Lentisphaeria bacterium]|nr:hypothetical protein [Lentisphaeria bacterium]